jgi:hypothetical protein
MLKLTGAKTSWCTLRVIVTLHELGMEPGLDYEFVEIDMAKGVHKSTAHKVQQPFRKVPILSDNAFVLFGTLPTPILISISGRLSAFLYPPLLTHVQLCADLIVVEECTLLMRTMNSLIDFN